MAVPRVVGRYMRYDCGVYLTNRYFHLIPINPEGYDYLNLS
jgi:hypothetical protein